MAAAALCATIVLASGALCSPTVVPPVELADTAVAAAGRSAAAADAVVLRQSG